MSVQNPSEIAIRDYTYNLPEEKIAQHPLADRDASKLLIWDKGTIKEDVFRQLVNYLPEAGILVFNTTRVVNARLHFLTSKQHAIELFCLGSDTTSRDPFMEMQTKGEVVWRCFVGNLKRWKEENLTARIGDLQLTAELKGRREDYALVKFSWQPAELTFSEVLERFGDIPIPPYLNRSSEHADRERYQTVYAANEGSVAAPTAGLHFTERVLAQLRERSVTELTVTLHVGAGTFKPVKADTMKGHNMHAEWMEVSKETIVQLKEASRKIIAVGTTSLRTLESLYWMGLKTLLNPKLEKKDLPLSQWEVYQLDPETYSRKDCLDALLRWMEAQGLEKLICETQILIAPPYQLRVADGLITNFHQPQSTLLLLVAAILGERWRDVYDYALEHGFRFLSYGDSSLLLK